MFLIHVTLMEHVLILAAVTTLVNAHQDLQVRNLIDVSLDTL